MLADIPKGYGTDIAFTEEEREKIASVRIPVFEDKDLKTLC
jgi:hypothetical protein